ncbi:MAG: M15 family metallopeptidase, partial [Minisyncoccia bacterium]
MTAIYAPAGYKPSAPTDVVIYLHGHKTGIPGTNTNIQQYLNYAGDNTLKLREAIAASGRNLILVAPTLGPLAQPGKLTNAANFDSYVSRSIDAIKAYIFKKFSYSGQFNFNKLIIAAHSGGGKAMLDIVRMPGTLSKAISEVWGFDCWYQASSDWTKYASANPAVKIFAYYYNSQQIPAKASNTCIVHSPYGHFPLITIYLKQRLANTACAAAPAKKTMHRRRRAHELEMENSYGEKGGGRVTIKNDPVTSQVSYIPRAGGGKVPIHTTTKAAWEKLVAAARADGIKSPHLLPVSGYRSSKTQERLWQGALARYGSPEVARKWVAPPGSSAHQSGRAIDFYLGLSNSSKNVAKLRKTQPYLWLANNATKFGFYPYS